MNLHVGLWIWKDCTDLFFFVCTVVCSKNLEWILGYCLRWSAVYPCQFLFTVNFWKLRVFWKDSKQICTYELLLYVLQHLHSRYVGSLPSRWQFSQLGWSTDWVERIKCDHMKYAGWFRTKLVSVHQILELLRIICPPWPHSHMTLATPPYWRAFFSWKRLYLSTSILTSSRAMYLWFK